MTGQDPTFRSELADRVLAACRDARDAGRPVPLPRVISPQQALSNAADAFGSLLSALDEAEWRTPALRDLDVQGLVGHLIGVEYDLHRCLAGESVVAEAEHVASTQRTALSQAGRPPAETYREWRDAVDRTLILTAGADLTAPAPLHRTRMTLGQLLVARAFELWAHENDIRSAVGLPSSRPEWSTLTLMTMLAVQLLPGACARADVSPRPASVHLVLTGAGGGTWDVDLAARGAAGPEESTLIAADAVVFCRLAANRLAPSDVDAYIAGDRDLAERVLVATATLALD
jgi:uncharacterized protein (TIGR03083 family)